MEIINSIKKSQIIFKELIISGENDEIYTKYYRVLKKYRNVLSEPAVKVLFKSFVSFVDLLGTKPVPKTLKDYLLCNDIKSLNDKEKKESVKNLELILDTEFHDSEIHYVVKNLHNIIEDKIKKEIKDLITSGASMEKVNEIVELSKNLYTEGVLNQEHLIEEVDPFNIDTFKEIIKYNPEKITIKCQRQLTRKLEGGFVVPSFTILSGGSKMGKTYYVLHWIKDLLKQNKNCLLILTEQNKNAFCNKILYPAFVKNFDPERADDPEYISKCKALFNEINDRYGMFRFIIAPIGTLGFNRFNKIIKLGCKKGKYDYIFVDMMFHLKSIHKGVSDNKTIYDDIIFNIIKMKNLYSVNIVGTCHADTQQAAKVRQDTEATIIYDADKLIAERKIGVNLADYVLGLHVSQSEAKTKRGRIVVHFDRWSECKDEIIYFKVNLEKCLYEEITYEQHREYFDKGSAFLLQSKNLDPKGYYSYLDIDPSCTAEEIEEAWEWVLNDYEDKEKDKMYTIKQKAYTILSNPKTRQGYDLFTTGRG